MRGTKHSGQFEKLANVDLLEVLEFLVLTHAGQCFVTSALPVKLALEQQSAIDVFLPHLYTDVQVVLLLTRHPLLDIGKNSRFGV